MRRQPRPAKQLHRPLVRKGDWRVAASTENRGSAEALVDVEEYTNARFGVEDGPIEWTDLGAADPSFDGCN